MQSRGEEQRSISKRPKQQELLHCILLPQLFHHSSTFHDYEKYMPAIAGTVPNNHAVADPHVITCKERVPTELLSLCREGENVTIGNVKVIYKAEKKVVSVFFISTPGLYWIQGQRVKHYALGSSVEYPLQNGLENRLHSVLDNGTP
jgi:hypothetical protein